MKIYRFTLLILSILWGVNRSLYAVPADPTPRKIIQADGTTLTIQLHGDEFYHYHTTSDGYLIVADNQNIFNYATIDNNGVILNSGIKARDAAERTVNEKSFVSQLVNNPDMRQLTKANKARRIQTEIKSTTSYPLVGTPKSLVILVNFSDVSFRITDPQISFTSLLNQKGYSTNGGTGSAKDYFRDNSMGVFDPQFDVVGPFTLPKAMDYYGGNNSSGDDTNPRQMVIDACTLAYNNGVDFSKYDTDKDGLVDNVFIYYSGYNEAEGAAKNTIWPHRWTLANYSTKFNGVSVFDYACTSELRSSAGSNMCGIGTFVHEFGHVLGLPDYYATNDAKHQTLSYWSVMDMGPYLNLGRTPPAYSAFDRFFLNWSAPVELKTSRDVSLSPLTEVNKSYLITQYGNHNLNGSNPSPTEFFTLENRQKKGWDTYLPGHGMLISRINYSRATWDANTVNNDSLAMGVDIIEADNLPHSNLSGDPFPGSANVGSYSPTLRSGTNINKPLTSITESNGIINFKFMGGGSYPNLVEKGNFSIFTSSQNVASKSQIIKVYGSALSSDISLTFGTGTNFEMRKSSETDNDWRKSISLTPTGGFVDTTQILVRYKPLEATFNIVHSETLLISSGVADAVKMTLVGKASRPIYVVPPTLNMATNVTSNSFMVNWNAVFDASGYYLTAYTLSEGKSSIIQEFNNGLNTANGWTLVSNKVSNGYFGNSSPALIFSRSNDMVESPEFPIPATNFSFYAKSQTADGSNLLVEGYNGSNWSTIDNLTIPYGLDAIKSYALNLSSNYVKFRMTYTKVQGEIIIDDVKTDFNQYLNYAVCDVWTKNTSDTLYNLISNKNYYVKVKASDKTLDTDGSILYENITAPSSTLLVKTLEDTNYKVLHTSVQSDGTITVILPSLDQKILVFNTIGRRLLEITPQNFITTINNLPRGQVYIFKFGDRVAKVVI